MRNIGISDKKLKNLCEFSLLDNVGKLNVNKPLRSINQSIDNRDIKMVLADYR